MTFLHPLFPRIVPAVAICLCAFATRWVPIGAAADDEAAVAPVAEEALEDEDVAAAPVDAEPLERSGDGAEGGAAVAPQALAQYMPLLERLLTVEMHYLRKVWNPDPEHLSVIRKAGEDELPRIAKWLQAHEQDGFQEVSETRPAERLTAVLLASTEFVLPREKAVRYRTQLQRRCENRREAAAGMITVYLDRRVALTEEQYPKVVKSLLGDWNPREPRNLFVYMESASCPLPNAETVDSVLNERQKTRWRLLGKNSPTWADWTSEVGLDRFGFGGRLKELDKYSLEAKP